MKTLLLALALVLSTLPTAVFGQAAPGPRVRFQTSQGNIDVQLRPDVAPQTVANFLRYVDRGAYDGSFMHRSVPGFIIQGGGFRFVNNQAETIPTDAPVVNEYNLSNVRGTIAMAKVGPLNNQPPTPETINSATDQWFFNESDANAANLDNQNGGFTVFGTVINNGLATVDAIAALPTYGFGGAFTQLPLINYPGGNAALTNDNFVTVIKVTRLNTQPDFFNGASAIPNTSFQYLQFPNGNVFGYYDATQFPTIYHDDLGFEYVFDANDGQGDVYLYDFASQSFFYTSPSFPFPYLYDFSLNTVLYYYPDVNNAGHYTKNPRYFYNYAKGKIIIK